MFNDVYSFKASANDLRRAVREVVYTDIREHIHNLKSTPAEYAKKQIKMYSDVKSSAVSLDQQLRDKGFKTTYRFAYNYNLSWIGSDEVVWDAYRLEYFYNLAVRPANIKFGHKEQVYKILDEAARVSYRYAQYVWQNNPKACFDYDKRLDVYKDWGFVLDYLLGVGFQFHPNDINEYITNHNAPGLSQEQYNALYQRQLVFKNWCKRKYDIETGALVLCPEHQEKLRKILMRTDVPYVVQCVKSLFHNLVR